MIDARFSGFDELVPDHRNVGAVANVPHGYPHLMVHPTDTFILSQDTYEIAVDIWLGPGFEVFLVIVDITLRFKIVSGGEAERDAESGECVSDLCDLGDGSFETLE